MKPTPGPWVTTGYQVYGPPDARSHHHNGRMLIGGVVDELYGWDHSEPPHGIAGRSAFQDETRANARLIAAAPQMLEVLQDLIAAARVEVNGEGGMLSSLGQNAQALLVAAQLPQDRST